MNKSILHRRAILRFLRTGQPDLLNSFAASDWGKELRWLDRSGLALPLAARLEILGPSVAIPSRTREDLHMRLIDNDKRMESMLRFFEEVNDVLARSGATYCCVKGFSLIPNCFNSKRERHQVDLDFLISPVDAPIARQALETIGYRLQSNGDSSELRFTKPWKKHLGAHAYLYQTPEAPAVELHTQVWEPDPDSIDFSKLSGFLDRVENHVMAGVSFPRLTAPHQFVYLLLHIFRHLLGSWTRMLSLYEVASYICSRDQHDVLWSEVSCLVLEDDKLASACALVVSLVNAAFPVELPTPLRDLCAKHLTLESKLWIDNYSNAWFLANPPGTKLPLLLQKQFYRDSLTWRSYLRRRLLPWQKPPSLSDTAEPKEKKAFSYRLEAAKYKISRAWYHIHSDCEYLMARVNWMRLRRMQIKSNTNLIGEI